jgi:hypothetical protein
MRDRFERGLRWLPWLALLAACEPGGGKQVGSDTNWLQACTADADCGAGQCRCRVCTLGCSDLAACGAIEQAQLCIEASELSATSCRLGFEEPVAAGICTRACSSHADCGPGGGSAVYCIEGVCLPGAAATPRGSIASVATAATDAAPIDAGRAGEGGAGGGSGASGNGAAGESGASGSSAASGSGAAGEHGEAGAGGVAPTGDGQLGGGKTISHAESGTVLDVPYPEPQCPCQSDLPEGAAAPSPGDAPANAYGNPSPPAEPSESPLDARSIWLRCAVGTNSGSYWFVADTECVRYENCNHACQSDADCPAGGSGSARPRCSTMGYCFLDCREEQTCPDGMSCVSGVDGAACYWARDVLDPECPAYCRQRPAPRECENWCADLLVACNADAGATCCEGLTCTEGGYCDDAP